MFCPNCGTEYRDGFTICSDCGATLIDRPSIGLGPSNPDEKQILWAGQNAAIRRGICNRLDAVNIPYEVDEVESGLMPAFGESIYRIQIRAGDREPALRALADLTGGDRYARRSLGSILADNSIQLDALKNENGPAHDPKIDDSSTVDDESDDDPGAELKETEEIDDGEGVPDDVVEDFDPDNATAEIWSGSVQHG